MEVSGKRLNLSSELCEICQTRGADGFCKECTEYMCQECFDHHVKAKPCRHHALCSLDQGPIQIATKPFEQKCDIHRNENLKYYCHMHEVVGCGDCMISNHDGCKPKLISNLATNFEESDEFKEMLRKIGELDDESNENMKRVQKNLKENKAVFDKALVEIRKFRKDINEYLDQAEKNVITEAKKYSNENESLLSGLQTKIEIVSKEVDDIHNKLDTNMHQGADLFIRMVECKPRISKVEQTVAEIKFSNTLKAYVFEPEQKLRDLLRSNVSFGCLILLKYKDSKQEEINEGLDKMQAKAKNTYEPKQPIETKQIAYDRNRLNTVQLEAASNQTAFKKKNTSMDNYLPTVKTQTDDPNAAARVAYSEKYYAQCGQQYGRQSQQAPQQMPWSQPKPTVNPQTGQPDYSLAWAEYYRQQGMYEQANAIWLSTRPNKGKEVARQGTTSAEVTNLVTGETK